MYMVLSLFLNGVFGLGNQPILDGVIHLHSSNLVNDPIPHTPTPKKNGHQQRKNRDPLVL